MVYCLLLYKIIKPLPRAVAGGRGPQEAPCTPPAQSRSALNLQPQRLETPGPLGQLLSSLAITVGKQKEILTCSQALL